MSNDFHSNSRSNYRAKRKKTNIILNSLIVIVLLLIIFVAYSIFASGGDKAATKKDPAKLEQTTPSKNSGNTDKPKDEQTSEGTDKSGDDGQNDDSAGNDPETEPSSGEDSQPVITEGSGDSNVLKTIENPAWKPVGTLQTGPHTAVYDGTSTDWQEMLNAISYATGLEQSNMIVHFLGRDKTQENASVGTVYSRDKAEIYKVYIRWVDGAGWQPTKVEELAAVK